MLKYALSFAMISAALAVAAYGQEIRELVSFNDGTQSGCATVAIADSASRAEIAAALRYGAAAVERAGCVNFAFGGN